tara:strand:- start:398 stop:532 length:135 start_codon:yes stop_codon:yes gene_type:complete
MQALHMHKPEAIDGVKWQEYAPAPVLLLMREKLYQYWHSKKCGF